MEIFYFFGIALCFFVGFFVIAFIAMWGIIALCMTTEVIPNIIEFFCGKKQKHYVQAGDGK